MTTIKYLALKLFFLSKFLDPNPELKYSAK